MENTASEKCCTINTLNCDWKYMIYIVYGCSWDSTFLNVQYTTETVHGLPDYIINKLIFYLNPTATHNIN